jgi:hypothetical protein
VPAAVKVRPVDDSVVNGVSLLGGNTPVAPVL